MTNTRNVELGQAVYQHTFKMLDAEPGWTGEQAADIAAALEHLFSQIIENGPRYAILDVSKSGIGASQTAGKVVGLYDDIVKAGEAMSDHWDLSGKQDFHIVPISKTV